MSAEDELQRADGRLSERDAEATFGSLHEARERDRLLNIIERAPLDDEPTSPEEERGIREAWAECQRGHAVALHEIRHEFE